MPIYEYKFKDCGKINEFLFGIVQDRVEIKCGIAGARVWIGCFPRLTLFAVAT